MQQKPLQIKKSQQQEKGWAWKINKHLKDMLVFKVWVWENEIG